MLTRCKNWTSKHDGVYMPPLPVSCTPPRTVVCTYWSPPGLLYAPASFVETSLHHQTTQHALYTRTLSSQSVFDSVVIKPIIDTPFCFSISLFNIFSSLHFSFFSYFIIIFLNLSSFPLATSTWCVRQSVTALETLTEWCAGWTVKIVLKRLHFGTSSCSVEVLIRERETSVTVVFGSMWWWE